MSARVVTETREKLEARRTEILASLGLTLEEFRSLVETRTLTGEEWEALEELDEIAFLLGEA
ncbi:MAG: hypothetical protein IRZ02_09695 [Acidothermus sp.]|nr:hypothetical protein [Acidothermus sp.]MCL6537881.1 hypothetical protein [Acidothermus sp.]